MSRKIILTNLCLDKNCIQLVADACRLVSWKIPELQVVQICICDLNKRSKIHGMRQNTAMDHTRGPWEGEVEPSVRRTSLITSQLSGADTVVLRTCGDTMSSNTTAETSGRTREGPATSEPAPRHHRMQPILIPRTFWVSSSNLSRWGTETRWKLFSGTSAT